MNRSWCWNPGPFTPSLCNFIKPYCHLLRAFDENRMSAAPAIHKILNNHNSFQWMLTCINSSYYHAVIEPLYHNIKCCLKNNGKLTFFSSSPYSINIILLRHFKFHSQYVWQIICIFYSISSKIFPI